ncbi:hypothetical protein ABZ502_17805 [Streptomyces abikoensis]|uniref:hypothetical protein n=1 Tax=Streptomyces abikoensis TaxID=97398 RepID=UPI0033EFB67D
MDWHDGDVIVAHDYTRMRDRPKRMFRLGGPLPQWMPGINMQACGVALIVALGWGMLLGLVSLLIPPLREAWWVTAVLFAPPPVLVGWMWSRPIPGSKLRPGAEIVIRLDWAFRQPRRVQGLGRSDEPQRLHWQAILWAPPAPATPQGKEVS